MSSPIHTAVCLAREGTTVELELGPTTAIGVHFPCSDFFGLSLLHEAATGIVYREPGRMWSARATAPIAAATSFDELMNLACIEGADAAKAAFTARFIVRAAYVTTRNFTPVVWTRDPSGGFRDPGLPRTDPRVRVASQALDDAFLADPTEARAPHATLRIEVTDPAWSAHLVAGMMWDVYAFDEGAPMMI